MRILSVPSAVSLLLLVACGSSTDPAEDAGVDMAMLDEGPAVDATPTIDAGTSAPPDRGTPPPDAAPLPRFDGLPTSCWRPPNSFCNPASNEGCEGEGVCDVSSDEEGRPIVACFPPATQALGEACNNRMGPFCTGGLRCMDGACMDTCCDDSECTGAERCIALDPPLGTLGVCAEQNTMCTSPGGFCATNADCCSNVCHVGHCH